LFAAQAAWHSCGLDRHLIFRLSLSARHWHIPVAARGGMIGGGMAGGATIGGTGGAGGSDDGGTIGRASGGAAIGCPAVHARNQAASATTSAVRRAVLGLTDRRRKRVTP
jgi:hypothetical protein